jgi:hypothetical protein
LAVKLREQSQVKMTVSNKYPEGHNDAMSSSKYTKTMSEAYAEVYEQRRMTGAQRREAQQATRDDAKADSRTGIQRASDIITRRSKAGGDAQRETGRKTQQAKTDALRSNAVKNVTQDIPNAAAQAVGGAARNVERARQGQPMKSQVNKPTPTSGGETEAERMKRRQSVGLKDDPARSAQRAKETQAAAAPKQDAANKARREVGMSDIRGSATPGSSTPAAAKPSGLNKDQQAVNKEYDRLRNSGDMKGAEAYGRKMHSAGASKSNFKMPKQQSTPSSMGAAASKLSAPKFDTKSTPAVKTPSIKAPAPKPAAAPKPMSRIDKATTGIKPMSEEAEVAYERWLKEQMTAGKSYGQPSGLDLRTTGQKMNQIKKSVQQNDKLMNKIQPPPGV